MAERAAVRPSTSADPSPTTGRTRDHVDLLPERDTRQKAPSNMVILTVAGAVLLIGLGALLGAFWTGRILRQRLAQEASRQAEERRLLAKEWAAVHRQLGVCPRCTAPASEHDRVSAAVPN